MPTLGFGYHPAVLARFPEICGGVVLIKDLSNRPTPAALLETYLNEQRRVLAAIGEQPLSEIASLAGWRAAFRQFGVDPTKYRSAAEALLRRLTKKGDIPSINALVDICNLVSIRHALPVAAFDTRPLNGPVTVRYADGKETFTAHDSPQPEHPEPGEVIFSDPGGVIVARRWCWKQSMDSTVGMDTTAAILTVESQHPGGKFDVSKAIEELCGLLQNFTGGIQQTALLDREMPTWSEANPR